MYDCNCLIHPFQNDPGTSQSQRVMDDLLTGAAKIDASTLADLLQYFVQISRHINFYDTALNVSDWQPFFQKSIPFTLASVIKTPLAEIEESFALYNSLFEKKPSSTGLQLQAYFIYYRFIKKINDWYLSVKDSALPIGSFLQILIKDKLQPPLKLFIGYSNAAVKWYGIKKIDFTKLDADAWNLGIADLFEIDDSFKTGSYSKFQQINNLYKNFKTLFSPFLDSIKIICAQAENNIEPSLLPLKEELQKKHPPHLGLLFAFLNIFSHLQDDLNGYTRKHLDFFYKDVLQLKAQGASPDKAHVIFEIQKQLEKYLLKKGLLVKDGKDLNKQQILFSLDDAIVVNKTEVADLRTLYLNNTIIPDPNKAGENVSLLQGVYMAPDATKADGIAKDFTTDIKNFYTLGNKESKYANPETKIIQPYPNARLGFILASPVLYLKEGRRTINVTIACQLQDPADPNDPFLPLCGGDGVPNLYSTTALFNKVAEAFRQYYVYVSEELIQQAIKKGISNVTINSLRDNFLKTGVQQLCDKDETVYKQDEVVLWHDWWNKFYHKFYTPNADVSEKMVIDTLFKKRRVFKIVFSGEKDWLEASRIKRLRFTSLTDNAGKKTFAIKFKAIIEANQPAVTFFDKDKLKEDYDTTLPVVKIELDDIIKVKRGFEVPGILCCVSKKIDNSKFPISFYYFLRNLKIISATDPNISKQIFNTEIHVKVCGLKNFIVQNDEGLQDVNGPVYPFGTRPDIVDFDVNHTIANTTSVAGYPTPLPTVLPNLKGPNFYIGSKEIFFKKWKNVCVNLNWKDKPVNFNDFYTAFIKREIPDPNNVSNIITILGLNESDFQINLSLLENGKWQAEKSTTGKAFLNTITGNYNRRLFVKETCVNGCVQQNKFDYSFFIEGDDFPNNRQFFDLTTDLKKYQPATQNGFILFNLQNQDFLHKDYAYVLARQMMAIGKYPDKGVEGAIYLSTGNAVIVFKDTGTLILGIKTDIDAALLKAGATKTEADEILNQLGIVRDPISPGGLSITDAEFLSKLKFPVDQTSGLAGDTKNIINSISANLVLLQSLLSIFENGELKKDLSVPIPNEPWTPIISNMSLDYTASATIEDIDLIHLYPYSGTYKHEEIKLQPTLFPTFCDEGTLFLGLKNLVPGNNVNLLFQLTEATSDSESEKQEVQWHYLDNNVWKLLRKGFEVLNDASENLTTSGIVKLAMQANMTNDNTIMPKGLFWIKASVPQNSKAVSETTGIYSQAISVTFTNDEANDKLRLSQPLPAGNISKLNVADANVKSVQQPYDSFGGEVPEMEQQYYVRVSEHLRHKGRAIQKFDYERLALQEFPQLFKAKCINHSFALDAHLYKNDFPYAPGYVILAVIPDLNKLQAGNSFEPKVPVSIIEKIEMFISKRTSPFVRFRAMNPRYEKINFSLRVNLLPGKDENYYKEQLKEDLKELLAPWAVGQYDKLTFGQCVYRSDIIRFLENTDYVDFITEFSMSKQTNNADSQSAKICPDTPRSILIAGDIEVCINKSDCEDWKMCYENDAQIKTDCCTTDKILITDYCIDKNIPIG
jgi:hypothetical protein